MQNKSEKAEVSDYDTDATISYKPPDNTAPDQSILSIKPNMESCGSKNETVVNMYSFFQISLKRSSIMFIFIVLEHDV